MKVLNLEDKAAKHWQIRNVLESCGIKDIAWETNLADGMDKIRKSIQENEPFGLIITDMNYPESPAKRRGEKLSGELLMGKFKEMEIHIPVILCSSVNYKYPELYGTVHFSERKDWERELKELVQKLL